MYLYSSTSDEVGHGCALWNHLSRIGNSVEDFEVSVQLGVKFQNACHVTAAIAVVWRRPNSNQILAWEHVLVALLYQLVSTADQLQAVHSTELIRHFRSEKPTSTARTDLPCFNVLRIRPHQVAEGAFVGNFLIPRDGSNLVKGPNVWRNVYLAIRSSPQLK